MEKRDKARVEKGGLLYRFDTTIEHLNKLGFLGWKETFGHKRKGKQFQFMSFVDAYLFRRKILDLTINRLRTTLLQMALNNEK